MELKIRKDYSAQYTRPITLCRGDVVLLGREETEEKWKGWIWAEHGSDAGWIPLQIVERLDENRGSITRDYTAKELDVVKGEKVIALNELNGWLWVKNMRMEEGWIPEEITIEHRNHLGRISLIAAVSGLAATEILIRTGTAEGHLMEVINTGFEGATVGGLADWFAVSALFRKIPIPYVSRHTNIIIKNRTKISAGIVDLVTNRWLSKEMLNEKLEALDVSVLIIEYLSKPANLSKVSGLIRKEFLTRISSGLSSPELAGFFEGFIREQIEKVDYAKPVGKWLMGYVESGSHNELIAKVLMTARRTLNNAETHEALKEKIDTLIDEYRAESFMKSFGIGIAEFLNIVDRKVISDKLVEAINNFFDEIDDPKHRIRKKLDDNLIDFAEGLMKGRKDSVDIAESIKKKILSNAKLGEVISDLLVRAKTALDEQLVSHETPLMKLVDKNLSNAVREFASNRKSQTKFNNWFRDTAVELVEKYHPKIGEMVSESLGKLDDKGLVEQIEGKVGNDLQFIRLNGAVIGFFAGAMIKLIKLSI